MEQTESQTPPLPLRSIVEQLRDMEELGYSFDHLLSRFLFSDEGAHLRDL